MIVINRVIVIQLMTVLVMVRVLVWGLMMKQTAVVEQPKKTMINVSTPASARLAWPSVLRVNHVMRVMMPIAQIHPILKTAIPMIISANVLMGRSAALMMTV